MVTDRWAYYRGTKDYKNPTLAQALSVYMTYALHTNTIHDLIDAARAKKSITIDYGYMVYTTFTKDYVFEIKLKPIEGYMTILGSYSYGYRNKELWEQ